MPPARIYLSLGSNIGDRAAHLSSAIAALNSSGVPVLRQSSIYETEPVDFVDQDWFLNSVLEAETSLSPQQLLSLLREIERTHGSRKLILKGPRSLDIDILFYGSRIIGAAELEIPHPRLCNRRFVLVPLAELAPLLIHPVRRATVTELLAATPDRSQVRLWHPPAPQT
ncbi:MAG TPA: 2-amino-4-hydroxy-6-hydroxymethyldihydropteridine diphosphokinase [Candidatus Dormibacteraeota bacterium]|nr:2-amino-4-hydroxy-6-hydroxymethyldihydropteridine diphosphokinase [Candidatus Dormibacteraeota bacterium]